MLQTVQRAEYWGVMLALQVFSGIHVGVDNLHCSLEYAGHSFTSVFSGYLDGALSFIMALQSSDTPLNPFL